jgi:hypothetical protein
MAGRGMLEEKLIDGLIGLLEVAVLPVAPRRLPAGTSFALAGSDRQPGSGDEGPDASRTRLVAFNEDGQGLGDIDTGQGSLFAQINGRTNLLMRCDEP